MLPPTQEERLNTETGQSTASEPASYIHHSVIFLVEKFSRDYQSYSEDADRTAESGKMSKLSSFVSSTVITAVGNRIPSSLANGVSAAASTLCSERDTETSKRKRDFVSRFHNIFSRLDISKFDNFEEYKQEILELFSKQRTSSSFDSELALNNTELAKRFSRIERTITRYLEYYTALLDGRSNAAKLWIIELLAQEDSNNPLCLFLYNVMEHFVNRYYEELDDNPLLNAKFKLFQEKVKFLLTTCDHNPGYTLKDLSDLVEGQIAILQKRNIELETEYKVSSLLVSGGSLNAVLDKVSTQLSKLETDNTIDMSKPATFLPETSPTSRVLKEEFGTFHQLLTSVLASPEQNGNTSRDKTKQAQQRVDTPATNALPQLSKAFTEMTIKLGLKPTQEPQSTTNPMQIPRRPSATANGTS